MLINSITMIDKEKKEQNERLLSYGRQNAKAIKKCFPDVEYVEVFAYVADQSTDISYTTEKTLYPDDLLYLYFPCSNSNCDGIGYNLTDILTDSLKQRKYIEAEDTTAMQCSGDVYDEEDDCYYQCSGYIYYEIEPKFRS